VELAKVTYSQRARGDGSRQVAAMVTVVEGALVHVGLYRRRLGRQSNCLRPGPVSRLVPATTGLLEGTIQGLLEMVHEEASLATGVDVSS